MTCCFCLKSRNKYHKISAETTTKEMSNQNTPSTSTAPKKKKREDFHLGTILGEGSYSTVIFIL